MVENTTVLQSFKASITGNEVLNKGTVFISQSCSKPNPSYLYIDLGFEADPVNINDIASFVLSRLRPIPVYLPAYSLTYRNISSDINHVAIEIQDMILEELSTLENLSLECSMTFTLQFSLEHLLSYKFFPWLWDLLS